jgi:hypothetical protein
MEYNTERENLQLREYGRNVEKMAKFILNVEDRDKRSSFAKTLVELMKQINPNVKGSADYDQKVWDDLFILTNFELDVDSPYDKPEVTILSRKPRRMMYNSNEIRYKHFGRNIEQMIDQAIKLEDPAEKEGAIVAIGKLMKSFYLAWNKDFIEDPQIIKTIKELSKNQLDIDLEKVKEYKLFDSSRNDNQGSSRSNSNNRNKNQNKGKRNQNRRRRNN